MAGELLALMQMLALDGPAPLGAQTPAAAPALRRRAPRTWRPPNPAKLAATWPWAIQMTAEITQLQALAPG
jgi:hypothetical protein